tara:strand:- start:1710 stop:2321 length:612 start_codon:yes stop_codon:yes gene_type:complete
MASPLHSTIYYTGAQCRLLIGSTLVEELNSIQYDIVTNKAPVYGYGSKYYDCIADGNHMVNGAFALNYVHPQYLISVVTNADKAQKVLMEATAEGINTISNLDVYTAALNMGVNKRATRALLGLPTSDLIKLRKQKKAKADASNPYGVKHIGFEDLKPFDITMLIGSNRVAITDVVLTSRAQSLMSNGEPIMETYRFIGKLSR